MDNKLTNFEEKIICLDCKKDITEERKWKGPELKHHTHHPIRYCHTCIEKMEQDQYYLTNKVNGSSVQKTSKAIEQIVDESIDIWEEGAKNQYY